MSNPRSQLIPVLRMILYFQQRMPPHVRQQQQPQPDTHGQQQHRQDSCPCRKASGQNTFKFRMWCFDWNLCGLNRDSVAGVIIMNEHGITCIANCCCYCQRSCRLYLPRAQAEPNLQDSTSKHAYISILSLQNIQYQYRDLILSNLLHQLTANSWDKKIQKYFLYPARSSILKQPLAPVSIRAWHNMHPVGLGSSTTTPKLIRG